eukprot:8393507-Karenia_brevis.AAC.1
MSPKSHRTRALGRTVSTADDTRPRSFDHHHCRPPCRSLPPCQILARIRSRCRSQRSFAAPPPKALDSPEKSAGCRVDRLGELAVEP